MRFYGSIILVFLCIIFMNCDKQERETKVFYYDVYSSNNQITAYYRTVSTFNEYFRIDSITRFNLDGSIDDEHVENFLVKRDTLFKILSNNESYPYLIIDSENCNQINRGFESETCLVEEKDYLVFTEQTLIIDGVKKKLVYDKNFNLVENEYLDGYLSYYRILRRAAKPKSLPYFR